MGYAYAPPRDPTTVLGRRIVAYVVDGLVVLIALAVALALSQHQRYQNAPSNACAILRARLAPGSPNVTCLNFGGHVLVWKRNAFLVGDGIAAGVGLLNLVVLQSIAGASIGKLLLGLRVVDEYGRKAGFGRVLVRWILLVIDGGIFLIGLITVVVTNPHRRIGDFAAGTYVVATASAGVPIGLAPSSTYAAAHAEPDFHGRSVPGWAPPTAPAAAPAAPGWGTAPPVAAPAPAPAAPPPAPQWAPPTAPVATAAPPPAAPPPAPQWSPPAAPPVAPAPAQWSTAAPPAPPPPLSPNAPPPAQWAPPAAAAPVEPEKPKERQPEAWWDKAIPAELPDAEESQS